MISPGVSRRTRQDWKYSSAVVAVARPMLNENDVGPPRIGMRTGSTKIWFAMETNDEDVEDDAHAPADIQIELAATMDAPIIVQATGTMRGEEEEEEEEEDGALAKGVEGGERTAAFLPRDDDEQHMRKVGILYICSMNYVQPSGEGVRYPAAHLPPHNNHGSTGERAAAATRHVARQKDRGLLRRRSFCLTDFLAQ